MGTVLVTGVGGASGIGAVRSLHDRTDHTVVGVDMEDHAAGFYLADAGRVVPAATDDGWAEAIRSTVEDHDVDVVIPTVDEELAKLATLRAAMPREVPVIAPRVDVVDQMLDKYTATRQLARAGHAVPETWLATEREDIPKSSFPLLVKPRRGRGSRGIKRVTDRAELTVHLGKTEYDARALLLQEFIEGTEYTTSVVVTAADRLLAVVPKEAIEKQGSTVIGRTRDAPAVASSCRRIHETLAPGGPINVQQIVDDNGVPHTIEINPRFSSTSCLSAAAGVDEFDLLIHDALGNSVQAPETYETDLFMRRYEDHVFVSGAEFEERANVPAGRTAPK